MGQRLEKEEITFREKEREENIVRNLPEGKDKVKALSEVKHRLQQRRKYQQIKDCIKGQGSNGISQLIILDPYAQYPYRPEEVTSWRTIHEKEELEKILIDRNREHLGHALGTPFTQRDTMEQLPFTADSEIAERVLQREDIEGPTLEATEILKEFRRKVPEEECDISKEEIRSGFRKWDERTSTSPSRLHLGIYHCITNTEGQEEEKDKLIHVITGVINVALKNGITLK